MEISLLFLIFDMKYDVVLTTEMLYVKFNVILNSHQFNLSLVGKTKDPLAPVTITTNSGAIVTIRTTGKTASPTHQPELFYINQDNCINLYDSYVHNDELEDELIKITDYSEEIVEIPFFIGVNIGTFWLEQCCKKKDPEYIKERLNYCLTHKNALTDISNTIYFDYYNISKKTPIQGLWEDVIDNFDDLLEAMIRNKRENLYFSNKHLLLYIIKNSKQYYRKINPTRFIEYGNIQDNE